MRKRVLEHTPGPWKAYPKFCVSLDRTDWVICDANGDFIAPTEGNARLAAASPEMKDLLEKAGAALIAANYGGLAEEIIALLRRIE